MAKKQKGPVSIIVDKPKLPPKKKTAPGNPGKLNRGNPHTKKDANGCTELEARFVQFYLVSWNLAKSIKNAGYDSNNASSLGHELLKKPHIKALVEQHRKEFAEEMKDMKIKLAKSYAKVAFSDISDYINLVEVTDPKTGKVRVVPEFKTTDALERGAGELIESIKIGRNMTVEIKLESKSDAKLQLARHIGFFEVDNAQTKPDAAVGIYQIEIPDNGRGDLYKDPDPEDNKK